METKTKIRTIQTPKKSNKWRLNTSTKRRLPACMGSEGRNGDDKDVAEGKSEDKGETLTTTMQGTIVKMEQQNPTRR